uniref:Secreted protein n=1 Tax=Anguilla anguilla TaxID=7936 RepID=A0A0E9T3T3_ANGAN
MRLVAAILFIYKCIVTVSNSARQDQHCLSSASGPHYPQFQGLSLSKPGGSAWGQSNYSVQSHGLLQRKSKYIEQ